jgi:hypothetical protein
VWGEPWTQSGLDSELATVWPHNVERWHVPLLAADLEEIATPDYGTPIGKMDVEFLAQLAVAGFARDAPAAFPSAYGLWDDVFVRGLTREGGSAIGA